MNKTIVFLCSGGGGNLRFIKQAIQKKWFTRWNKLVVIADRECPALNYARKEGITNFIVDFNEAEQINLTNIVMSIQPDLIITTVHRILNIFFLKNFENKLINLHYSLLPAFSGSIGATSVKNALKYGSLLVGATVHLVTEIVDGGEPQVQIALPVNRFDTPENTMDTVFRAGCFALFTALRIIEKPESGSVLGGTVTINNRSALINPIISYPIELNNDFFWTTLKT